VEINMVRTNVRALAGFRSNELAIGTRTLVVGPNGVGKTRWQNALELALTKTADDVWLRQMTRESDLAVLMPADETKLYAEAVFDAGFSASYSFDVIDGKAKKAEHKVPGGFGEWSLPVRAVYSALSAGPDKARLFFVPYIVGTVTQEDIARRMPPEHANRPVPVSLAALLSEITQNETLAKEFSNKATAQHALAEQAQLGAQGADPTEGMIAGAKVLVSLYEQHYANMTAREARNSIASQASTWSGRVDQIRQANAAAEAAKAEGLAALVSQVQQYDQWLTWAIDQGGLNSIAPDPGPMPTDLAVWSTLIETGLAHANALVATPGVSHCHGCGSPVQVAVVQAQVIPHVTAQRQVLKDRLAVWQAAVDLRALRQGDVTTAQNSRAALVARYTELQARSVSTPVPAEVVPSAGDMQIAPLEFPPGAAVPETSAETGLLLQSARAAEQSVANLALTWKRIRDARQLSAESSAAAKDHDKYAEALRKVTGELMDAAVSGFVAKAQRWMPAPWKLHIQLRAGDRDVFKLGVVENGQVNMAPSGAQLASAAIALALTCAEQAKIGYALITLPEERDWDGKTLRAVMKALSECPYQVFLTSTTAPVGKAVPGWTVIDLTPEKPKRTKDEVDTEDAVRMGVDPTAFQGLGAAVDAAAPVMAPPAPAGASTEPEPITGLTGMTAYVPPAPPPAAPAPAAPPAPMNPMAKLGERMGWST
jgi:hypothetical protein